MGRTPFLRTSISFEAILLVSEEARARARQRYQENREQILVQKRGYYQLHKDEAIARAADWRQKNAVRVKEYLKRWREQNRDKVRAQARRSHLKQSYGLSLEDYNAMLTVQGERCAICNAPLEVGNLYKTNVDHDHTTGRPRAILCRKCNSFVGYLETSDPEVVKSAIMYIRGGGQ